MQSNPHGPFDRAIVVVLDGVGCGQADDATDYDAGTNSLRNASQHKPLNAPALQRMGIEYIDGLKGMVTAQRTELSRVQGAFGSMEPTFAGGGSPEGHQALMGHVNTTPYLFFDREGFPPEVLDIVRQSVAEVVGRPADIVRYPGTDDISGTIFIQHPAIGPAHLASKGADRLVVPTYASSDSVVQIALHHGVVPQAQIEVIGQLVRHKLDEKRLRVGRVIMRPFTGESGAFNRVSEGRRDYGLDPDESTLIDHLSAAGVPVYSVGKAADMFNGKGFEKARCAKLDSDLERIRAVARKLGEGFLGLLFANLLGTDELFGHRRKPVEYMMHITAMGEVLAEIQSAMTERDLLAVTSDHGNDPAHSRHTNHTRERVPLTIFSPRISGAVSLGRRASFADLAATLAENFGVADKMKHGESFLESLTA